MLVSEVDGQGAAVCAIVPLSLVGVDALDYDPRQTGSSIDRRRVGIAGQLSSLTQLSPFLKWSSLYYDPILVQQSVHFFLDLEHTLV